jgi:hypothetical protein
MRAPDSKQFYWFSEADYKAIRQCLADCGVDLDATMVGQLAPGKRWWLTDDSAVRHSLRDGLQYLAWYCTVFVHKKPPTPAQAVKAWRKTVATLENACDLLARTPYEHDSWYSDDDWNVDGGAYEIMALLIDELKERIAKRRASSPRVENARTRHNDYWRELMRLLRGITVGAGPLRRKDQRKFLVACTPPGLFPNMTDKAAIRRAIDGFFSNLNRRPHRPTS